MLRVTDLKETGNIEPIMLQAYIAKKITALMEEYRVNDLNGIGTFVVLDSAEIQMFPLSEMEFVEVLEIGGNYYLHGVRMIGDSYGEDAYLPVEVVRK